MFGQWCLAGFMHDTLHACGERVMDDQLFSFRLATMLHFGIQHPQRSIISSMSDYNYFNPNRSPIPDNGANRRQLPCNAMQTQGILRTVGPSIDSPVRSNDQRTPQCATCAKRVHDAVCHVSYVQHQKLDDTTRLQESSDEGTEANHGAGSDLEVGSGTSRAGSTSARGSGRGTRARSAAGAGGGQTRSSGAGAVGGSSAGS